MDKKILTLIVILLMIGISAFIIAVNESWKDAETSTNTTQTQNSVQLPGSTQNSTITLVELQKHSTQSDCWVPYKGKVYDITSWLPRHPGSAGAIAPYCGTTNFESAFTGQHGESQVAKLIAEGIYKGDLQ